MIVEMKSSKGIQVAYKASNPLVCDVCKGTIPRGGRYTRHQAPDPRHVDRITHRYKMVPYVACVLCAPYNSLEDHTGEIDMRSVCMTETEVLPSITRTNTPRPSAARLNTMTRLEALARGVTEGDDAWLK